MLGQKEAARQYNGRPMVKVCVNDHEFVTRSYESGACLQEMV